MKKVFRTFTLALLPCLFLSQFSRGAGGMGNDNPTGVAGEYNGSVTTGGSYDPWTGNAKRFIDDLTVTGSVGAYPLKFTRILNTRGGSGVFGDGGGWTHSYQWGLSIQTPGCVTEFPGATVSYPDGRRMIFYYHSETDTYEDISGGWPGDRLVHVGNPTSTDYDFKLKDGGTVQFRTVYGKPHFPKYIVDPYGQKTTLDYIDHSPNYPTLWKITEPVGRYLQITYRVANPAKGAIDYVEAYDGQGHQIEKVQYVYQTIPWGGGVVDVTFHNLVSANYDDGHHGTYDYDQPQQITNDPWSWTAGNVKTCDDVRFNGPMSKIKYDYVLPHENMGCPVGRGQIKAERNMTTGQLVSSMTYPSGTECMYTNSGRWIRTETRGEGATQATRKFTYSGDPRGGTPELVSYTDFALPGGTYHTTTIGYSLNAPNDHYYKMVTDARPNASPTKIEMEFNTSAVIAVIHANGSSIQVHYTDPDNPYYVKSRTDENHNTTFYDRYCVETNPCEQPENKNRVWRIRYPDNGLEEFHYNQFGEILTHRMTSGGTEVFTYTPRGLKESYTPPGTTGDPTPQPTVYTYYTSGDGPPDRIDRLKSVTDPRLNTTTYEYNQRGQVTRVTHPGGLIHVDSEYNADGTLHTVTDELQHTTTYTYDEYKRVLAVTDPLGKTTTNSYDPGTNPAVDLSFTHTTSSVYKTTTQMGKTVKHKYDANFRVIETTQAPDTPNSATTTYQYDEVGNQTIVTEPNDQLNGGQNTGARSVSGYDDRNRRTRLTDARGHATVWVYDDVGNMKSETRADQQYRTWDVYDSMNRVKQTTGFLGPLDRTTYNYDEAGNLLDKTDSNGGVYSYLYDARNRKESATYPIDAASTGSNHRFEWWRYDAAGNIKAYKNPGNQWKHFKYDERNRQRRSYWNTVETSPYPDHAVGDETHTGFDDASRVTSIETNGPTGITSLSYGYDWANHKIWEDQTLNYVHMRRVETLPDDDGNRRTLTVAGVYSMTYDYTQRQQLFHINKINGASENPFFEYKYDRSGNLTKRQNVLQGRDSTLFGYDNANRVTVCVQTGRDAQTGQDDRSFSVTDYNDYDLVNNVKSISRQEDQYRGERFEYDYANQLTNVSYGVNVGQHTSELPGQGDGEVEKDSNRDAVAALVADPVREPLAAFVPEPDAPIIVRTVSYVNDPITRKSMNDNGTVTTYTPNKLNQYTAVNGQATVYDGNFNLHEYDGWTYGYDADNRLISAISTAGGGHSAQFVYDGLGRCVKRTIDGVSTVFTYDGWKPIVEWNVAGTFVAWNLYGPGADEILIRFQPDTDAGYIHYHLDAMGNVQFLLSEENLGLEKYTYDAFGRPTITSWTGDHRAISLYGNRFLFTGREYLYTLGIYDYRHRHYHPGLGRFIQTDPIGFGGDPMNLYRYCSGNPILHGDPTGLLERDWNNKLTSFGGGDWVTGSDGLTDRDRHDHTSMGSGQPSGDAPKSLASKDEGNKGQSSKAVSKETGGSDVKIKRTLVTKEGRVLWFFFYRGLVYFEYELTASGKPLEAGVHVTETIEYGKSKWLASSSPHTRTGITDKYGHIGDNYAAAFLSKSGRVEVIQTLRIEGAGEVQWKGVLRANGTYTSDVSEATFH